MTLQDAAAADAVFVTNSLIGIQPVGELCGEAQRQLYPGSRNSRCAYSPAGCLAGCRAGSPQPHMTVLFFSSLQALNILVKAPSPLVFPENRHYNSGDHF